MKQSVVVLLCLGGLALTGIEASSAPDSAESDRKTKPVDYTTQIKTLLQKHCTDCHSADDHQSGFRLDAAKLAIQGGDRGAAIIPGNSEQSLLYLAILGKGDVIRMPAEGPALSREEIALIKRWIDEGAKFPQGEVAATVEIKSDHWSFQPIKRPKLPAVKYKAWVRNPIDAFILARLEQEGLEPSPEANRETLIRRLSLDFNGLPPRSEDVDAFLADDRPGAYERLVDRILASPRYGERWGRHWLDLARYADSNGFTIDGPRSIWKYRDWVIDAFNRDLPFDQFTIEQLAGDMLPNATIDQIIATGFHRNTLINQEGGTDPEQFRIEAVVDRVNTTGAAFLGLTVGCSQCHEHKFDPLTQREFYEMFAVFNNCDDKNSEVRNSLVPMISVPTPQQQARQKQLIAEIAAAEKPLKEHDHGFLNGLPQWVRRISNASHSTGESSKLWTILEPKENRGEEGSLLVRKDDNSIFVDFSSPGLDTYLVTLETPLKRITAVRLEALTQPSLPNKGPGRADNGNFILSEFELLAAALNASEKPQKVRIAKAVADHSQEGYLVSHALDGKQNTGWAINVKQGSLNVDREAAFFPEKPISNDQGTRLLVKLHHRTNTKYTLGRFRISVSSADEDVLRVPESIRNIAAIPSQKRSEAQKTQLENAFKATDTTRAPLAAKVADLKKQLDTLTKAIPTTLVMKERKVPREARIMIRGDFLRPGARVYGGVPAVLPPLPENIKDANRLDFARWLVDPDHPLTSRVTMNRFWQRFFGKGIVLTENDFGTQGIPPSHPELLDWLASEFQRQKWGIKAIHRLIVTSATYRQSSQVTPELLKRDSANLLLARQSRVRLEAEIIRDSSLAAGDLLSNKMFGPGFYPPQPAGIYVLTQVKKSWPESQGDERYRRGLYTYFWRSSPYPFLPTFDAPDANTTCTRRTRSNTPLQSLTLANGRSFVEMAKGLSARILREGPDYDEGRLHFAFRACLARNPNEDELKRMTEFVETQRTFFSKQKQQSQAAAPDQLPPGISAAEGATWTAVSRVLLNLDEFITRE